MIGIDIIDHTDPLLKIRRKEDLRFISHLEDNIKCIQSNDPNDIWRTIWAIKEAIFKSKRELVPFNPKAIVVTLQSVNHDNKYLFNSGNISGWVTIGAKSTIALAKYTQQEEVFETFSVNQKKHSLSVRDQLKQHLLQTDFELKEGEIPYLKNKKSEEIRAVSFTHHHELGGFAYLKD